jgi:aryl-alcohol dehydrogenase-like predicted oxidoreductase
LHKRAVTSVIVGARNLEQLGDNIAATALTLSDDEMKALDEVSALPREYPGWMLERQGAERRAQL